MSDRSRALFAGTVVAVLALAGCTGTPATVAGSASVVAVTVTTGGCGPQWSVAHGGPTTFALHNAGTVTTEVDLVDPATGGVYAEVEALAPATTRPMRVVLGANAYALRCLGEDTDVVTGPTVRVPDGPADAAPAVRPVTEQDLVGAVHTYRAYVTAGLTTLATDVAALAQAVRSGSATAARPAWLTAHLAYERLGAAYDTFDDFADAIDGLPDGLPDGLRDRGFTGFHRLEYGLWHGQSATALAPVADQLVSDVDGLRAAFPTQQTDPNDLPLRSHEILENAVQFQLTGAADLGSGTGLATLSANLDGTQAVLDAITSVIAPRYPDWPSVATDLARVRTLLATLRAKDGTYPPVRALTALDRQRLDGAVGDLLETLAPIAAIGDVRRKA